MWIAPFRQENQQHELGDRIDLLMSLVHFCAWHILSQTVHHSIQMHAWFTCKWNGPGTMCWHVHHVLTEVSIAWHTCNAYIDTSQGYITTPNYSLLCQIAMKHDIMWWKLRLWPLWPWKVGQIKHPQDMWCSLIRCIYSKNLVILAITVSFKMVNVCFSIMLPGGHIKG